MRVAVIHTSVNSLNHNSLNTSIVFVVVHIDLCILVVT